MDRNRPNADFRQDRVGFDPVIHRPAFAVVTRSSTEIGLRARGLNGHMRSGRNQIRKAAIPEDIANHRGTPVKAAKTVIGAERTKIADITWPMFDSVQPSGPKWLLQRVWRA